MLMLQKQVHKVLKQKADEFGLKYIKQNLDNADLLYIFSTILDIVDEDSPDCYVEDFYYDILDELNLI